MVAVNFSKSGQRSRKGFTLVELLVVIGIIALLISILLPALSKARQAAVTVSCAARIRQLSNAVLMYANENRGYYAPVAATGYNATYNRPNIFPAGGDGFLVKYLSGHANTVSGSSIDSAKLYVCPALAKDAQTDNYNAGYSYEYNGYLGGVEPNGGYWVATPWRMSRVRQASNVALWDEGSFEGAIGRGQRFKRENESLHYQNWTAGESLFLHSEKRLSATYNSWGGHKFPIRTGTMNIGFADGSVRGVQVRIDQYPARPPTGVYIDPNYPRDSW